jgi:hypothetical protein
VVRTVMIGVAVAVIALAGCSSSPTQLDEKQRVSEACHSAAKKRLREPESARFGDKEFVAKIKIEFSEAAKDPNITHGYGLVGTINGRNGFGGMGDPNSYTCDAYFNKSGQIDESKTLVAWFDKIEFLDNYVNNLKGDAVEPIVTRAVKPDGSSG